MRYLVKEDLTEVIQERLLDDSLQLTDTILDGLEEKAIAFSISYNGQLQPRPCARLPANPDKAARHVPRAQRRKLQRKVLDL
ncbi:MAG: hypothetical protein ACLVKO_11660 [Dysgonomonas sp.]